MRPHRTFVEVGPPSEPPVEMDICSRRSLRERFGISKPCRAESLRAGHHATSSAWGRSSRRSAIRRRTERSAREFQTVSCDGRGIRRCGSRFRKSRKNTTQLCSRASITPAPPITPMAPHATICPAPASRLGVWQPSCGFLIVQKRSHAETATLKTCRDASAPRRHAGRRQICRATLAEGHLSM